MGNNKKTSIKSFIFYIIIAILVVLFSTSTITLIQNNQEIKNTLEQSGIKLKDVETIDDEPSTKENPKEEEKVSEKSQVESLFSEDVDLSSYRQKYNNNEVIGRLEIPGLFNILLTKTSDNKYYLNHSIDKKKDVKGTEFLDFRTDPTAKQVNVYGHNSTTYDIPFRKLEKFLDKDFFDKNPYILLQHDGGRRIYKIFSIKEVTTDNEHMVVETSKEYHKEHIQILLNNSIYTRDIEYDENSNLLTVQTCSYSGEKTYYVISAIELE